MHGGTPDVGACRLLFDVYWMHPLSLSRDIAYETVRYQNDPCVLVRYVYVNWCAGVVGTLAGTRGKRVYVPRW